MSTNTELHRLIGLTIYNQEKWTKVLERIESNPEEVKRFDDEGYLPIHCACYRKNVPMKVIKALVQANATGLTQKSKNEYGRIPLHIVVRGGNYVNVNVIKLFLEYYKDGAAETDSDHGTPLHHYLLCCESPSFDIIKMLVEAHPYTVRISDHNNWYPLHYASKFDKWEVIQYLIDLYPEALRRQNLDGETPRNIASQFGHHFLHDRLHDEEVKQFGSCHQDLLMKGMGSFKTCFHWFL